MTAVLQSRGIWFLADRVISQGGGLLFMACLARTAPVGEAASFIVAFACASLLQPLFANACQPLAIRLWDREGREGFMSLWVQLLVLSAALIGGLIIWQVAAGHLITATLLLHALLAPLSLASAPLIAADRWKEALSILIPVTFVAVLMRILALVIFDNLLLAALFFSVEPLVAGLLFGRRSRLLSNIRKTSFRPGLMKEAAPLMLAMASSTLFWRAPVLAATLFLTAGDVLLLAFSMQIMTGMMLVPNALCQSLIGLLSASGDKRDNGLRAGGIVACSAGIAAIAMCLIAAEPAMQLVYGPAAAGAGVLLLSMSPAVGLGTIWRLTEITTGLDGQRQELLITRLIALAAQGAGWTVLFIWASPMAIATTIPLSLILAALIAPMAMRRSRPALEQVLTGARSLTSVSELRRTSAVFLHS